MKKDLAFRRIKVEYVGYANERSILKARCKVQKQLFEEEMFVDKGELSFLYEGSKMMDLLFCGEITVRLGRAYIAWVKDQGNRWCRNLGLPEITKLKIDERLLEYGLMAF